MTRGAGFGEYKIILQNPQPSEEKLIYKVTNFNKVTNRCTIELITPLPGLNMNLASQELVSFNEIENIDQNTINNK